MSAVRVNPPAALLAERRRLGLDVFDEMWEGELHMVPAPDFDHQRLGSALHAMWVPIAAPLGLHVFYETGLYDPAVAGHSSFRVPALTVFDTDHSSPRGIEGAARLVVELRSPRDESFQKLDYYDRLGVGEVLIVDRPAHELRHWQRGPAGLSEAAPDERTQATLKCFPVSLSYQGRTLVVAEQDGAGQVVAAIEL